MSIKILDFLKFGFRQALHFLLQPGIVKYTAENQSASCQLQDGRRFSEQNACQKCGHHRFAKFGGRNKGRRKILQTPAENAVTKNCGKNRQQQTNNNSAGTVTQQGTPLHQTETQQHGSTGRIHHKGIYRRGNRLPNDSAQEHIGSHRNSSQQRQKISVPEESWQTICVRMLS